MKYKINKTIIDNPTSLYSLVESYRNIIHAMLAVFLAGDICLTQIGYDKLDDSLKQLFIAKED